MFTKHYPKVLNEEELQEVWSIPHYGKGEGDKSDLVRRNAKTLTKKLMQNQDRDLKNPVKISEFGKHHIYQAKKREHSHYIAYNPETSQIDMHMSAIEKPHKNGTSTLKSILLSGRKGSTIKAHHLYHHLITKHNKILQADDQSPGGKKVWQRLNRNYKDVHVHNWDPKEKKGSELVPNRTHTDTNRVFEYDARRMTPKEKDDWKIGNTKMIAHKKF
jgi:hypothetical protein